MFLQLESANEMTDTLTNQEKAFIRDHILDDISKLLLQAGKFKGVDSRKLILQIEARQKARYKLPDWYRNDDLIFPPPLSVEQCSSEATARYKASIVGGSRLVDGSGGMGVDCYYMSQRFEETVYIERQEAVADSARANFESLNATTIQVVNDDLMNWLETDTASAEWLYLDPARRDNEKRKVVLLQDCSPDVAGNLTIFLDHFPRILVKTSPLLDIDLTITTLLHVREVHVVGLGDECKEVLYLMDATVRVEEPKLITVLLAPDGTIRSSFQMSRPEESNSAVIYGDPEQYLYEPHAAILKAGAFKGIAARYQVKKLAINSHLYTSDTWIPDFPGRGFRITGTCRPNEKELRQFVPDGKANLTLRNFPAKIDDLRKKWRLREGGTVYLFATTLSSGQTTLIITEKVS